MMSRLQIQTQINIPKSMKTNLFLRNNEWLMQCQGLGWQSGKIGAKSATKNSENTP